MTFTEYSKEAVTAMAEQVEGDEARSVITPNGPVAAQPGEWEVRYKDGNVRAMTDEEFQEEFGGASESDKDKDAEDRGPQESLGGEKARTVDPQATVDRDSGTLDESDDESNDAQSEDSTTGEDGETGSVTRSPSRPTRRR
jgi:hypothetical protein